MDEKYKQVDELQTLAKVRLETDSGGIHAGDSDDTFKQEYQQQSIRGDPVANLAELYDAAEVAQPIFRAIITKLCKDVIDSLGAAEESVRIEFADLKGKTRAFQKAKDDYSQRSPGPAESWLYDIVRGSIYFSSAEQICTCLEMIREDPSIHIVKAKNRFRTPTLTGYRDMNLAVQIETNEGFKHICEIQIHHAAIKFLDKILNSHEYYEYFRAYFAGATDSLEDRLEDLRAINIEGRLIDGQFVDNVIKSSTVLDDTTIKRLRRLGVLLRDQLCEYRLASLVYKRIFELRLRYHTESSLPVADAYHDLGITFRLQENYEVALTFYKWSGQIKTKVLGENHPSLARIYNNIAIIHYSQKNYAEASACYQKAISLIETSNLQDDVALLATLNTNYALNLTKQVEDLIFQDTRARRLEEARVLHLKAMEAKDMLYGEGYFSQADNLHGLGLILYEQSDLEGAIQTHRNELALRQMTLGKDHVSVARAYYRLAMAQRKAQNLQDAFGSCTDALETYKKTLGESTYEVNEARE